MTTFADDKLQMKNQIRAAAASLVASNGGTW
jgi:hypothetical protein